MLISDALLITFYSVLVITLLVYTITLCRFPNKNEEIDKRSYSLDDSSKIRTTNVENNNFNNDYLSVSGRDNSVKHRSASRKLITASEDLRRSQKSSLKNAIGRD